LSVDDISKLNNQEKDKSTSDVLFVVEKAAYMYTGKVTVKS